ncbi:ABC transporter substrate-binding protein [Mesorhizobium sp. P5_C1]
MLNMRVLPLFAVGAMLFASNPAAAQQLEKVKVATTFLGLWDTSQPTLCKQRGEFEKAGLDVEVISTRGGSENVQAVVAGGMDIGYSPGINAVLAASMQGAKIKIISAEFMGQNDTFFYVPAASPIKGIDDLTGKTVAFSRPGGATEAALLALKTEKGIDFKPTATGGMDATFTMIMTGQIDVGYSVPPSVLGSVEKGEVRVLFSGDDIKSQADLTGRVIIANSDFISGHRDVAEKFLKVLDGCIDWAYANPEASAKFYGELNKVDANIAAKGLAFYKRPALAFGPIAHLDRVIDQAVAGKSISRRLTDDEQKQLIDIVYSTPK